MTNCRCRFGCEHERHKPHHNKFTIKEDWFERQYYWNVAKYVMDSNISPSDADDLELFQDAVFDSPWGRIHIHFYEQLFKNYYQYQPDWALKVFARYLLFLENVSSLFTNDAFHYIFKKKDVQLITNLMKEMSPEIKLRFIKMSENYPNIIKTVPKLKMYNLFS
jgi:hypothetical protein